MEKGNNDKMYIIFHFYHYKVFSGQSVRKVLGMNINAISNDGCNVIQISKNEIATHYCCLYVGDIYVRMSKTSHYISTFHLNQNMIKYFQNVY